MVLILVFGALFRLVLVHGFPSLSTDIYRYVWDGRLTCHWINPYRWSPWDTRLAAYRDIGIWQPMEYKAYQTVYMPVSQLVFAINYALFRENLIGFKFVYTLIDIATMPIIALLLGRLGKDPARVIWYAWCPLPIVEIGLAGHQDGVGVLCLMIALIMLIDRKIVWSAIWLAAAGLTKGFALLLLPLLIRFAGKRLATPIALALIYLGLPLWVYLPEFLHGMEQYLNYVHVNAGLFSLVDWLVAHFNGYHYWITSKLSDIAILATVGWSVWSKPATFEELIRRAIIVIAVCLLVVPTLFPWYLVWLLPLVVLYGRAPSGAFLLLGLMVNLVYVYYFNREVYVWLPLVEYLPFYAVLIWEIRSGYWRAATSDAAGVGAVEEPSEKPGPELSVTSEPARAAGVEAT